LVASLYVGLDNIWFLAAVIVGCGILMLLMYIVGGLGHFISSFNPYKQAAKWIITPIAIAYGLVNDIFYF